MHTQELMTVIMTIVQLILSIGNLCIMFYALNKFLSKPRDTMEERIAVVEAEMREVKEALRRGNVKFESQDKTNEVLIHSVMALIEFEIQYCLTEHKQPSSDLEKARDALHKFLASGGR